MISDTDRWHSCVQHDWTQCAKATNCYAYALNRPEYGWAVPGAGNFESLPKPYFEAFNQRFDQMSLAEFRQALADGAVADGLVRTNAGDALTNPGNRRVALFFAADGLDFHWFRQDDDGTWSHKDGWGLPVDAYPDGTRITDPLAFPTNYPVFGGFFEVPKNGVALVKRTLAELSTPIV